MTRERLCVSILGESVDLEVSAEAREHLTREAERLGLPSISALVQSLCVCAAYPHNVHVAAALAKMPFARWIPAIVLSATGWSALGGQIARATDAVAPSDV